MAEQIFGDYLGTFKVALDPQFFIESYIETHKIWDPITVALLSYFLKPGDYCIDAGANAGFISLAMAKHVGSTGKVFSFEPNPLTYNRFRRNLELNPGLENIIRLEQLGLDEQAGILNVFQAGGFGNAYLAGAAKEKLSGSPTVSPDDSCSVIRLDEYPSAANLLPSQLRLIKIDVEGMELQVLRGAAQLISKHHPIVLYETLLDYFEPQEIIDIEGFLREHDYSILGVTQSLKLRATTFPDYGDNTVAIWNQDIPKYLDALHNASQYSIQVVRTDSRSVEERLARYFRTLVIAALEPRVVYIATAVDSPAAESTSGFPPNGCEQAVSEQLKIQVGFPTEPLLSAWNIEFMNDSLDRFTAAIRFPEGSAEVIGSKTGGFLTHL